MIEAEIIDYLTCRLGTSPFRAERSARVLAQLQLHLRSKVPGTWSEQVGHPCSVPRVLNLLGQAVTSRISDFHFEADRNLTWSAQATAYTAGALPRWASIEQVRRRAQGRLVLRAFDCPAMKPGAVGFHHLLADSLGRHFSC